MRPSLRRRFLLAAVVLLGLLILAGAVHRPVLTAIGSALVVDDTPQPADAIVVLAGATPSREAKAAQLFREGWAPRVIISRAVMPDDVRELIALGVRPLDWQGEARLALEKYGVPADHIVALEDEVRITEAELRRVHALAREHGYRRLILVTSLQHTRRVKVIWERETRTDPVAGLVVAAPTDEFSVEGWWRKRRAAEAVLHEYLGILLLSLGLSPYMS
ncbi:MAG TPA: YdcF family protein [Candidatus Methylomirabilis sp.]|nr:YdcF family protein [Candidatus Methylomirabilis sp.]